MKGRLDLTRALTERLGDGYDTLFVLDNGSDDGTWEWVASQRKRLRIELVDASGMGIYAMWNAGVRLARARAEVCDIAFLNNDIRIEPGFLEVLRGGLRIAEDLWAVSANHQRRPIEGVEYVHGTFKTGGFTGFAFMVRGESFDTVAFDENYTWWYGDDDFVAQIHQHGGRVAIVGAATVEHVGGGSQTARYDRSLLSAIERDRRRMWSKWGHF